ncbi:rhamnulokinase [Ktedonobacter racemifer]|uniref:Carbohydrate kinase, FGGY n=1 Tax=Ktedonobacter racemifer DSM 44963 TaxID=485913 RepID=D6TSD1_KTERA|nr:rhamnulokinase family protein [Ktedonobacter racemifer]EFH83332.1 Carbohydrate kinase, FGGY [Ktedonobacter racemifer DSM 44963]
MTTRNVAAVDLGAESGRIILGRFNGKKLLLEEVHRFANRPVTIHGHRFWNIPGLWDETLIGLRKARQRAGSLDSIGVDTWGVDYGLVDRNGFLLGLPFQYRDQRTSTIMEQVCALIPRERIYAHTGIQFLPFNTLFQLTAHEYQQPGALAQAHRLLMIPDLFHNWLSGSMVSERTNASTTQCWDAVAGVWDVDLLTQLGLPTSMLPLVVEPGTPLGPVLAEWQDDLGSALVIAPATHDTGSAIAAAPVSSPDSWGYISSGTWSLVGVELPQPLISPGVLAANYTNEGGVFGTTRFLKNVMGLWLLQECQRQWARDGHTLDYETLSTDVAGVPAFAALVDPDDPRFLAPMNMPATMNAYLQEHGQEPLQAPAAFARCILESLVLRYCEVFRQMGILTGKDIKGVHVLGGGARNAWLNQWLANALGIPVIAGPHEATAYGNALMQLVGLGDLQSLAEVRTVAQRTATRLFEPQAAQHEAWQEAAGQFRALTGTH